MEKLIESLDDHTLLTLLTLSQIKDDSTIKSICESLPTFTPSTQTLKDRLTTLKSKTTSFIESLKSKVSTSSSSITTTSLPQKKITIYVEVEQFAQKVMLTNDVKNDLKCGDINPDLIIQ